MLKILCDNRLRLVSGLPPEVSEKLRAEFNFKNPQAAKLSALGYRYHKEPKFIDLSRFENGHLTLPRGGMNIVRMVLDQCGLDYEVDDRRTLGDPDVAGSYEDPWQLEGGAKFPPYKRVLWGHQRDVLDAITNFEQVLIRSPTASGKTSAVIAAIASLGVPALVIMWDSGLLKQWQERIELELGIPPKEQGLIQGKTCRLRPITLAMQQTLNRYSESQWQKILPVFGLVACDEVQRYAANTFTNQIDRFPAKYRVGVSADERRKDGKSFMIYSMFGPVRHEVDKQNLIDKRLIHDVEVFVVPTNFTADWYVEQSHLAEDENGKVSKRDVTAFGTLLDEMERDRERNALAVSLVKECVREGLPTLTFTHRVNHAKIIDAAMVSNRIPSGLALGGPDRSEEFGRTIEGLRDGSLMVGCGTFQKLGVGHDIPTVAAGITITPVHSNRAFLDQVKGRICRTSKGKENARILILWDRHVFGLQPLLNLRRWNNVIRVWDEWEKRWKDVTVYLSGVKNGQISIATEKKTEASIAGIFGSIHR
jgi:superfamily II DNA or RNA helicase